ncbi:predicted protein [Histoplasma capsulatum G186AR]|uniref:Uncharacterized protein n=1 Tax=Ajellomyces capsulatus (strain G186AR / H82 / ATCC MYA-2454 / RMSCC 2432) TaxID=447093 RepID=C0NT08_AJECG|nr:uncharacterized protein HCBG_06288 [Histoplasma capsulatum G186AR]EEH05169.1 predicted protein [Histoplasma capsulatum G186AR]
MPRLRPEFFLIEFLLDPSFAGTSYGAIKSNCVHPIFPPRKLAGNVLDGSHRNRAKQAIQSGPAEVDLEDEKRRRETDLEAGLDYATSSVCPRFSIQRLDLGNCQKRDAAKMGQNNIFQDHFC